MQELIEKIRQETANFEITDKDSAEAFRLKFLVRKGSIPQLFEQMKTVSKEDKPAVGKLLNELKLFADGKFKEAMEHIAANELAADDLADLTLPGRTHFLGAEHPVQKVLGDMKRIFQKMGFSTATGPEIERDAYNFTLLNFAPDHPARDMQDTFFIKKEADAEDVVLRTHTSPVQIRVMLEQAPPIRVICPGKVFRNEAVSARSYCVFHQLEGLYVDKGVTFADLKSTIYSFARQMFGSDVKMKFRPSYFPFTEPSAEVDITCYLCGGKGCRVCKHTGWLEILGCGMVHPNVLRNCGIDPEIYSGYAFGMGIERTALLRYNIDDIRLFFENDLRMLSQFE
ncbi:phenylalanyl-tRNA synthetase, alpha subunit [Chloroherpeton thalassium ATCC 35110]|uniref:Phenylalanine--tRNA ligase alpha subunit n=1 Tax=Chloroherpeton thalassium (strain ATCC 35110 / GB-78) TaxID=517418 RepID=SYFA_CHLT3|nr:phenylalanine--tRNA ligase subunit alpha [Chloroherpeton thalassium]B3QUV1.1 RecName: Full=Phenylalanine--tRNA ligase alpha subunit; AltName: Full=Phenylalanyl-tRNA synthetase alpha subunit; Short=PheRS [Chloroherpeton thalassium ATCC 35110]ACF14452.1 phenylalanyl-tRNA synthetase, alpha subunit [Chloroherpeton thalassium ATCC 35110]